MANMNLHFRKGAIVELITSEHSFMGKAIEVTDTYIVILPQGFFRLPEDKSETEYSRRSFDSKVPITINRGFIEAWRYASLGNIRPQNSYQVKPSFFDTDTVNTYEDHDNFHFGDGDCFE